MKDLKYKALIMLVVVVIGWMSILFAAIYCYVLNAPDHGKVQQMDIQRKLEHQEKQ